MTHKVLKPFHSPEHGRIVQRGEAFGLADEARIRDLVNSGLIEPVSVPEEKKHVEAAPSNKDAASKRKTK